MHVGHSLTQSFSQSLVCNLVQERGDIFWFSVEEPGNQSEVSNIMFQPIIVEYLPVWLVVSSSVGEEINSCESGLFSAGNKHNHWLPGRVLQNGVVGGLGHGDDPAGVVSHVEALDVELQRHWSHVRMKVEGAVCGTSQPLSNIFTVGQTKIIKI